MPLVSHDSVDAGPPLIRKPSLYGIVAVE